MRFYWAILLFFISSTSAGAVTANFTVDYAAGCTPLVVHFTNTSTGATSYSWDLGNGTLTPSTNPSTSYITPGTYTVTLTAHNGSATNVKTMVITVYPLPTVSFVASDTTVCPGAPTTFSSTSVGGTPGPMTYLWNFGDGSTSTSATPSHIYSSPGMYNVTLLVTNSQGCTKLLTKIGYIQVYTPPSASFSGSPVSICNPPGSVTFTNLSSGALPLSFLWSFGFGPSSTLPSPTNTYSLPGSYTVKLVVTDAYGCKDSVTRPAYIFVATVTASFAFPASACMHSTVSFPNTSTTHTSRVWNYGDGSLSDTAFNGSHAYIAPGTYTVTLTIVNGPCTDVETHVITILPPPVASFTIAPTNPCPAPVTINYTSTTPPGSTVTWLYEGGATGSGPTGSHTYSTNGIKVIKMVVTDPSGCIDTVVQRDTIYNINFTATANPYSGCVPLAVSFQTTITTRWPDTTNPPITYPFPITSYSWGFGDGATGSGPTPSHTYTLVGTFIVTVTATTSNGCVVSDTLQIHVGAPPVVTFSVTPSHVCYGHAVTFTATVISGPVDRFEWSTGDGLSVTSVPGLTHFYTLPGTFTATLTPYYNGCPGVPFVCSTVITVDSPKAIIAYNHLCSPVTAIHFIDKSLGDDSHVWIFGDGTTSTLANPDHVYPAISTYTVTLATYNATSGCRDTTSVVINILQPPIDFTATDTAVCVGDTVRLTALYLNKPQSFRWYVNGATTAWWNDSAITDTFHAGGLYTVKLIVLNAQGCYDTVIKTNYIIVGDPVPDFTATPSSGCVALSVTFHDISTDVPGATLSSFSWTFGDGTSATVGTPTTTHIYTAAGTYLAKEVVTDIIGCVDSAGPLFITAYRPHAAFSATNTHPCINVGTSFTNTSAGYVTCLWQFGDGSTSTGTSPTHSYSTTGSYTVTLVVTDIHGCNDTMTLPGYINVTKPDASFTMSDTFSICPPLLVTFTNTSTGGVTYDWTFGDGNISVLFSPTNMYITPGLYPVQLIVTNTWGCKDTADNHLNLYGYSGSLTYTPLNGCVPLLVHFNAAISNVPNIIWDFGDGSTLFLSGVDTASHLYTVPGAYTPKLILSDNSGCQNSSVGPFVIKVDEITAKFGVFPAACIGSPFYLVDSSTFYWSPVNSWFWTFGPDTSSLSSPVHPPINNTGSYPVTLTVKNSWGCTATLTDNIVVYPLPTVTTSPDTVVCVTDPATLTGYGAVSYFWSGPPGTLGCTNCNPATAVPVVVSTYTVIGTDIHGCKDTNTVTVGLRTHTTSTSRGDTSMCNGGIVPLFDTGGHKYLWIPAGGLNNSTINNPWASPASTVTYTVVAQLGSCIPDTNFVKVEVFPLPTVDAGPDQEVQAGTLIQLQALGLRIASYEWIPSGGLSCNNCPNPEATVLDMTKFVVNVTSLHGCKASDSVNVFLFCSGKQLFLPNVFTPNADGENDVFYPRGVGINMIRSFRIYNRWGELLFARSNFQINDASNAWDGTYQGVTVRPDVYVYVVDAVCSTGKPVFVKGDVTLIK